MAVLFFSRALHLDPQEVRGGPPWAPATSGTHFPFPVTPTRPLLSHHQVPAGNWVSSLREAESTPHP